MNAIVLAAAVCGMLAQQGSQPAQTESAARVEGAALEGCSPVPAAVQWVGAGSKHPKGFYLVRTQEEWRTLWASHMGLSADAGTHGAYDRHFAPHVDLERYAVVAYFRGTSTNHDGEVLKTITHSRAVPESRRGVNAQSFYPQKAIDTVYTYLRFEASTFQTSSFNGKDSGVSTSPYGIWLVPLP